jgi:hypothetical protein
VFLATFGKTLLPPCLSSLRKRNVPPKRQYTYRSTRHVSIYQWLYIPLLGLGRFFSFFIFYTVGRTPWTGDQPVTKPLPAHSTAQTQNKRTRTFMPQVGFEPIIPVFERAKTVHALDLAATVISSRQHHISENYKLHS